jgi:amino acid adenylation domain-containing protein
MTGARLSPQQRHVWNLAASGDFRPYVATAEISITGPLDVAALDAAIACCVERHEILRTTFATSDVGVPVQAVGHCARAALATDVDIDAWIAGGRPTALSNGSMLRAALGRVGRASYRLVLELPAVAADAATVARLASEIPDAYDAIVAGRPHEVEGIPFRLISEWQHQLLREDDAGVGIAYWRRVLGDAPPPRRLRFERRRPSAIFTTAACTAILDADTDSAVRALAARSGTTREVVLAACWHVLIASVTGEPHTLIGVTFDGRTDADLRHAPGPLAHVLPIAVAIDPRQPFAGLVRRTQEAWDEAAAWQDCFAWSEMPAAHPNAPEPILAYAFDAPPGDVVDTQAAGVSFALVRTRAVCDRFWLRLVCDRNDVSLEFDASRFVREDVDCLLNRFIDLVRAVVARPDRGCGALEAADDAPDQWFVLDVFRQRVQRTPDRTAIASGDAHVSFADLDARSNRIAHLLARGGHGSESIVAVAMRRTPELIAAMVGAMKAGAAWLALDPEWPPERLAASARALHADCLLTTREVAPLGLDVPRFDLDDPAMLAGVPQSGLPRTVSRDQLAYVISTSGSTGAPRGVAIPHGALANHMQWMLQTFALGDADVVVHRSPSVFDASVWEWLAPLLSGARLALPPPEATFDVAALLDFIADHEATVLQVVPTLLGPIVDAAERAHPRHSLRLLFCGGEVLTADLIDRCAATLGLSPINLYGPAETCIDATAEQTSAGMVYETAPIGRPIANVHAYVIDPRGGQCAALVTGELCIGGAGVGRGYLRQPDLTAERWVPDRWSVLPGGRLYRTGDAGWRGPNGVLHFVGRDDDQVKIRGVRVELEEIRLAVARHADVRDCAIVAPERSGRREVVAYVEPARLVAAHAEREWRRDLQHLLPDVAIPARFVVMERLPRSAAGKIDRHALWRHAAEERRIPPRTETEARVAVVWQEVLNLPSVGIDDSFFSLGGHSLMLTQVLGRLRAAFEVDLPLRTLFDAPTVADVAHAIDEARRVRVARGGAA